MGTDIKNSGPTVPNKGGVEPDATELAFRPLKIARDAVRLNSLRANGAGRETVTSVNGRRVAVSLGVRRKDATNLCETFDPANVKNIIPDKGRRETPATFGSHRRMAPGSRSTNDSRESVTAVNGTGVSTRFPGRNAA